MPEDTNAAPKAKISIATDEGEVVLEPAFAYVAPAEDVWQRMRDLHHRALGEQLAFDTAIANDLSPIDALSAFSHTSLAVTAQLTLSSAEEQFSLLESLGSFAQSRGSLDGLEGTFLNLTWGSREHPGSLDVAASVLKDLGLPSDLGGGASSTSLFDTQQGLLSHAERDEIAEALGIGADGSLMPETRGEGLFGASEMGAGLGTLFPGGASWDTSVGGEGAGLEHEGGAEKKPKTEGGAEKKPKTEGGGKKKPEPEGGGEKKPKTEGGGKEPDLFGHVETGATKGFAVGAALGGAYGALKGMELGAIGGGLSGGLPGAITGMGVGGVAGGTIGGIVGGAAGGIVGGAIGGVVYGVKKWGGSDNAAQDVGDGVAYVPGSLFFGPETGCPERPGESDLFFHTFVPSGPGLDALVGMDEDGTWAVAGLPSIEADGTLHTGFLTESFFDDVAALPAGTWGEPDDPDVPRNIKLIIDGSERNAALEAANQAAAALNASLTESDELTAALGRAEADKLVDLAHELELAVATGTENWATIGPLARSMPLWMAVAVADSVKGTKAAASTRTTLNTLNKAYNRVLDLTSGNRYLSPAVVEDLRLRRDALLPHIERLNFV